MARIDNTQGWTTQDLDPKRLFEEYYADVFSYFNRRGFAREEARDLVQETFLEVLRGRSSYRGEAPAGGWVMGIARNVFRGVLRYRNREKRMAIEVSLESLLEQGRSIDGVDTLIPLDRSLAAERGQLLRQEMANLPSEQRDCMLLRIDQGLSYREIADVLQISIEAVKARLFQAKQRLRQTIGRHFGV